MIDAQAHRKPDGSIGELKISVTEESLPDFISLINRALNCWDTAPRELKELGDLITHGRVTQDHTYKPMNTTQNTDHYNEQERSLITGYIYERGIEAWKTRVLNGTTGAVLRGEATD